MSVNKGKEGGFFLKHFIAIPAGKVDGIVWQTLAAVPRLWYTDKYEWAQF